MSRNTEFQFVSTDAAEITNFLITVYENLTGVSVRPASPEKLFAQWVASVIIQERVYNNYTANQNIPSRAEGKNLDALAELYYLQQRPQAKPAYCTERFTISEAQTFAILVPKGTRVTDASNTLICRRRLHQRWRYLRRHRHPVPDGRHGRQRLRRRPAQRDR